MRCVAVSALLGRAAACAATPKLVQLGHGDDPSSYRELPELTLPAEAGHIDRIEWTGLLLSVSTEAGIIFNFLASLPILSATHGSRYIYLTSPCCRSSTRPTSARRRSRCA